jgi:hypothetical protein
MKKLFSLLLFLLGFSFSFSQVKLDYYLPQNVTYNTQIPTPKAVLGFEIGEWHLTHDQLTNYMHTLDAMSDRIVMEEYGRSYEARPLNLLVITAPKNFSKLEQLRQAHVDLTNPQKSGVLNTADMPLVVWLGYSVHGNEPSGANASALVAYHLAAAQGAEIDKLLENTIILLDPCFNPDGFHRFSAWANQHKSKNLVTDPQSREFNEVYPGGRFNHYWFDLNRDWLLVQHPESQGRVRKFHEWKPNILTDHHEMGSNATFFFQPGVPSRNNALTPKLNQELTAEIGKYHAQALDSIGSLYYTKEGFDDFYYGKGSSYPDVQGAVGILFEQASSRGHAQETVNGVLRFPFTIRNQFNTSLSTLRAGVAMRPKMLDYQRDFYKNAPKETGGYVFGDENDKAKPFHLAEMLKRHQIEVLKLNQEAIVNGKKFKPESSFFVSLNQPQVRLIKAIFETQTQFTDSIFYDISTWTMPLAFNLQYAKTSAINGEKVETLSLPKGTLTGNTSKVGYVLAWDSYYAPRALYRLQAQNIRTKVLAKKAGFTLADGKKLNLDYGTIFIPATNQNITAENLHNLLKEIAEQNAIEIFALPTGLAIDGVDAGSNEWKALSRPNVLLIAGSGVAPTEAGQVWHLLDQRYDMPVSIIEPERIGNISLQRYNTIVMTSGNYSGLNSQAAESIKNWVRQGNTLIAVGSANNWVKSQNIADIRFKNTVRDDSTRILTYADKDNLRDAQNIDGIILEATLDISHPLCYGLKNTKMPLFKGSTLFAQKTQNPYQTPLVYTKQPLLSGYISPKNLNLVKETAAVMAHSFGRGQVISFTDDPNFRAFWYGTNHLFANALFFGKTIGF